MDQRLSPAAKTDIEIRVRDSHFHLLPERAALWVEQKTLLASDLHWAKTEIFHDFGSAVPNGILKDDLARLSRAITRTRAERLLILGDLVHAARGLRPSVVALISEWRAQHAALDIELILGNHDRGLKLDPAWGIRMTEADIEIEDFIFTHDTQTPTANRFTWSGHIHPVFRAASQADSLRLPCYEIRQHLGFLPAFSAFTGGVEVTSRSSKIYVVADTHVVQVR